MPRSSKADLNGPARAAEGARRDLARMARPAGEFDASRYFRGAVDLGFFNIGTTAVRRMAREIHQEHADAWSLDDAVIFTDCLIQNRYIEAKGLGLELLARYRRSFTPALLQVCKRWLASDYSANWATTDAMCGMVIGPLVVANPALTSRVASWSRHPNMWVRRASAVALIPSVRRGAALNLAYDVAHTLHPDREDLIQKAVGWLLREAGKIDPGRLERYLKRYGPIIPRTTLRYAIERMPVSRRKALMAATRA